MNKAPMVEPAHLWLRTPLRHGGGGVQDHTVLGQALDLGLRV